MILNEKKKKTTQTVFTSKISMLRKLTDLMRGLKKIISNGMNKLIDVIEFWK